MSEELDKILEIKRRSKPIKLKVQRPPLNWGRIIRQSLVGVPTGLIGGVIGFFVGASGPWWSVSSHFGEERMGCMILGAIIGYALGSPIGVYLAGSSDNQKGSFWATLGGSVLGFGLFFVGALVIQLGVPIFGVGLLAIPPICASIGFDLTRRYK